MLAPAVPDAPVLQTTIQRALSRTSIYRDNMRYGRGRGELKAGLGGKKSRLPCGQCFTDYLDGNKGKVILVQIKITKVPESSNFLFLKTPHANSKYE